jgi:hypothetical protein
MMCVLRHDCQLLSGFQRPVSNPSYRFRSGYSLFATVVGYSILDCVYNVRYLESRIGSWPTANIGQRIIKISYDQVIIVQAHYSVLQNYIEVHFKNLQMF